jgi:hypothetical protein
VAVYHLLAEDTVDRQVYRALRTRQQVVDAVLNAIVPPRQRNP